MVLAKNRRRIVLDLLSPTVMVSCIIQCYFCMSITKRGVVYIACIDGFHMLKTIFCYEIFNINASTIVQLKEQTESVPLHHSMMHYAAELCTIYAAEELCTMLLRYEALC